MLILISSHSSSTPFYPSKWCELRNAPQLLFFLLFSLLDSPLNPSRSLGASNYLFLVNCLNGDDEKLFKLFLNFIEIKRWSREKESNSFEKKRCWSMQYLKIMDEFTKVQLHKCYEKLIILKIHVISLKNTKKKASFISLII